MTTSTPSRDLGRGRAAGVTGTALVVALVVNLALFGVGHLLDLDFAVEPPGGEQVTITAVPIVMMTAVPLVLAGLLLALVGPGSAKAWTVLAWVGLAVGVLTVVGPLDAAVETSTGVLLALMHLVVGTTWFLAVRRAVGTA